MLAIKSKQINSSNKKKKTEILTKQLKLKSKLSKSIFYSNINNVGNKIKFAIKSQITNSHNDLLCSIKHPNNEITITNCSSCGRQNKNNYEDTTFYILKVQEIKLQLITYNKKHSHSNTNMTNFICCY